MQEVIKMLSSTIRKLELELENKVADYHVYQSTLQQMQIKLDSALRQLVASDSKQAAMQNQIDYLVEVILDMQDTQKVNTAARKQFEAGYYGGIGE